MANLVLNGAKGRLAEIVDDGADLIIVPMAALVADATNVDQDPIDLATFLLVAGNTEATGGGWTRKVHLNAAITVTVDHPNDKVIVILDVDDTFASIAAANDTTDLLVCVDGANDAARRVVSFHDFVVTTDGNDVIADYDQTNGIWQAA